MAGKRRRHPPVRCECDGRAEWDAGAKLYVCGAWDADARGYVGGCGKWYGEDEAPPPDDGRIRSPEDALDRLRGAVEAAAGDDRLSELDRRAHGVYCTRAIELGWVEIMASDYWVCERLGLDPAAHRNGVRRSRARLAALGYVKKMREADVTHRGLRAQVAARKRQGKRSATLIEVRKAPGYPTCEHCGGEIPDIQRVSKRYCSNRCRKAAWRDDPNPLRDEVYAMAERALASR